MKLDYDFDKMIQFGTEEVDENKQIVNPQYRQLNYTLRALRNKIRRLEAKLFPLIEELMNAPVDEVVTLTNKQEEFKEQISVLRCTPFLDR